VKINQGAKKNLRVRKMTGLKRGKKHWECGKTMAILEESHTIGSNHIRDQIKGGCSANPKDR